MELCYRYDPTEEYKTELPVEGMTINRYKEKPAEFDEAATTIWRVEHDKAIPQDEDKLVACVRYFDLVCSKKTYRCNHEHDCCGCPFTQSFAVEYVSDRLAYIRKLTGFNY
jgi:hypothetical protein